MAQAFLIENGNKQLHDDLTITFDTWLSTVHGTLSGRLGELNNEMGRVKTDLPNLEDEVGQVKDEVAKVQARLNQMEGRSFNKSRILPYHTVAVI